MYVDDAEECTDADRNILLNKSYAVRNSIPREMKENIYIHAAVFEMLRFECNCYISFTEHINSFFSRMLYRVGENSCNTCTWRLS